MVLRHKAPEARVERAVAVVAHHKVVVLLEGVFLSQLTVDIDLTIALLHSVTLVCLDAAAIHSHIPALSKFGRQKFKRLDGLVAHAKFPINTGKLEGFNNKIKVAKRNAYGFRNLDFFFSYIRFLSLPKGFVHPNL